MPIAIPATVERLVKGRLAREPMAPLTESTPDLALAGSLSRVLRLNAGESLRASSTRPGSVSCRFV